MATVNHNFKKLNMNRFNFPIVRLSILLSFILSSSVGTLFQPSVEASTRANKTKPAPNQKPLTARELGKFQKLTQQQIQTTLDLAGLGKIVQPPIFDVKLRSHRAKWAKTNAAIAPFLGSWMNNWEMFLPSYRMAVFPSQVKGQVCVIEYQDNTSYIIDPESSRPPNPPPRFFTLKIRNQQAQTSQLRLHRSLIRNVNSGYGGNVEFMGVAIGKKDVRLYASQGIPKLDSGLPKNILQQFSANKCQQE